MSIFEKSRFEIWNQLQHPYKHTLSDFAYAHSAIPWVTTLEGALNAVLANLYPNTQGTVATPADLPTGIDTPNIGDVTPTLLDYRVVIDDGDGKGAGYRWEQREGEASPSWHKVYDMDWGEDSILSNFLTKTNDTYVSKMGQDEVDKDGNLVVGDLAGQFIYGGASAGTNLTLFANSGDGTGADTGFVQFGDQVRPLLDNAIDLGTTLKRFKDLRLSGNLYLSDISVVADLLTSSTGQFNFDNDNLVTTGNVLATLAKLESFVELKHITTPANATAGYNRLYFKSDDKLYKLDSAGVEKLVGLEFTSSNDNRLIRSDGSTGEAIQESGIIVSDADGLSGITSLAVDNLLLDGNTISSVDLDGDINLTPNGAGSVTVSKLKMASLTQDRLMTVDATGVFQSTLASLVGGDLSGLTSLAVDNLTLDGNTLSSTDLNGDINLAPNGSGKVQVPSVKPVGDNAQDIGEALLRIRDLFIAGNIKDGTNTFAIADLMKFRDASVGAAAGHTIIWDDGEGKWVSADPDSTIDHGLLTPASLLDDDHSQYLLLAGRSGGQEAIGGTDASDNLTLRSTSNVTKGSIVLGDHTIPEGDNSKDLGTGAARFKDLYMSGQLKGSRLENVTTATLPASSAANIGRSVWNTDTKQMMIDTGLQWVSEGVNRHVADLAFDGLVLTKDVDVSALITDARNAQVQLLNNNNDFNRIYCNLKAISATTIRIETNSPLPVGSYRIVVIE